MTSPTPHQPWIEIDLFIANGGKILFINNPTSDGLEPFYNKLNEQYPFLSQLSRSDTPERAFYLFANFAIYKCMSNFSDNNTPTNPAVGFAVAEDGTICGFIYIYEAVINSILHTWVEHWVALPDYKGAGSAVLTIVVGNYMNFNRPIAFNTEKRFIKPNLEHALSYRQTYTQDSKTLYQISSVESLQKIMYENYEFGMSLPNYRKLTQNIPTIDEVCVYSWATNTWYPQSQAPQDLGTPPVYEDNQVYSRNYDTNMWEPYTVLWK